MILPSNETVTGTNAAPPAYTSAEKPAPKYAPKKDFGKAFAELQGRYGYDGMAPILADKEHQPKEKKVRTSSGDSTESKKSFVKSLKNFVTRSPSKSPERHSATSASSSAAVPKHDAKVGIDLKQDMKQSSGP